MNPFFSNRRRSMRKVIFFLSSLMMKKGWFDLASARHSMGTLCINSTLLDLKDHSAASTLQVTDQEEYFVDMGALNCLLPTDQLDSANIWMTSLR
ncbi:hypothetical protein YC2023_077595 [Brassica napus]